MLRFSSQSYKSYNYLFCNYRKKCKTEKNVFTIFLSIPIKHDIFVITEKLCNLSIFCKTISNEKKSLFTEKFLQRVGATDVKKYNPDWL